MCETSLCVRACVLIQHPAHAHSSPATPLIPNPTDYSLILVCHGRLARCCPAEDNREAQIGESGEKITSEREKGKESGEKRLAEVGKVRRVDKYTPGIVLCPFSFNVSDGDGKLHFLRPGDCHQFAPWHLNQPLQIRLFEMQIRLCLPRQIKRHTNSNPKKIKRNKGDALMTIPTLFFNVTQVAASLTLFFI